MNRIMYKLELLCVKYVPILIAVVVLIDAIFSYFDVYLDILNYIAGTSFLTLIPMYISSYAYKFCEYHRMFIHYILTHKLVSTVDLYIGIPVSDLILLSIYLVIAGVFILIILYLHQKCKNDRNDKEISTKVSR